MKRTPVATAALLIAVALSGCAEPAAEPSEVDDALAGALDDAGLTADSSVPAPEWSVGQYFGHHVYFGAGDTQGTHINTVVLRADGSNYFLVTDNQEVAEFEAMFDVPILGDISKKDLSTTSFGGPFSGYPFPLTDGKTWEGQTTIEVTQLMEPITRDFTATATFNPAIEMPGSSKTVPGFDIVAMVDDVVLFETNYVPEIGWYASYTYYDITTDEPEDMVMFVRSMGYGENYAQQVGGVVYDITATTHIDDHAFSVAPEGSAGHISNNGFVISEDSAKITGIMYAFSAVAGHSQTRLVDPNGGVHGPMAVIVPDGADPLSWGAGDGDLYEFPHIPGDWAYAHASVGFVSGGGAIIWELFEEQIIL